MNSRATLTIVGLLLFAAITGGCSRTSYSNPAAPTPTAATTPPSGAAAPNVVITIVGMNGSLSYSPSPATVKVGQTVAWKNADGLPHTATADAGGFNTGTIAAGATSGALTMTTAGTFPYHCEIHGFTMTGTLTVTP
jgi:plastocyanin